MTCSKDSNNYTLSPKSTLTLKIFEEVLWGKKSLSISKETKNCLDETREFINYLLEKNIKVYGITTGFADFRDKTVKPTQAAELSKNLLLSHDAGIGKPLDLDVVLGVMIICANALSIGKELKL